MKWLHSIGLVLIAFGAIAPQALMAHAPGAGTGQEGGVSFDIGFAHRACTLKVDGLTADFSTIAPRMKALAQAGRTIKLSLDDKLPDQCRDAVSAAMHAAGFEINRSMLYIPGRVVWLDVPVAAGEVRLAAPCVLTINGAPATFEELAALAPRWNRQVIDVHFEPLAGALPDCAERVRATLRSGRLGNWTDDAPGGIETFQSGDAM